MKWTVAILTTILFSSPLCGWAQVSAGMVELSLDALGYRVEVEGDDSSRIDATLGYGYFLTDAVETKLTVTGSKMEGSDASYTLGGGVDLHMTPSLPSVPYVGLRGGWSRISESSSQVTYGAKVGLKSFIAKGVALDLGGYYARTQTKIEGGWWGDMELDGSTFGFTVGIAAFIGGSTAKQTRYEETF